MAVKDGKIEGVNLLQEAISILKVAGISLEDATATAFSTIETDLAITARDHLCPTTLMDSHDFQATGGGTIGFDQKLNLAMNLNLSQELSQKIARSSPAAKLAMKEGRVSLPSGDHRNSTGAIVWIRMKGLTGKVQEQARKRVEEAIGGLLKGTTKPEDLKQQGRDLLKGLLRH